jgi:ribosomal protein S18 acetylase RimI-like enzyme
MTDLRIQSLTPPHAPAIFNLYQAAASIAGSGLARTHDEISIGYVEAFLERAWRTGMSLGAFQGEHLVGEIHAARLGPRQSDHVLGDLTIAVHPKTQGKGVGSALFAAFFDAAASVAPQVTRIELTARSGNLGALRLYERLGFTREGRLVGRVRLPDGTIEDDIPMARNL